MTWRQKYIARVDERLVCLFILLFVSSGIGTVVLAQSREAIEAVDEASRRVAIMEADQLLAVICILSLILAGWTQYILLKITKELHERPCYYKQAEKEARNR